MIKILIRSGEVVLDAKAELSSDVQPYPSRRHVYRHLAAAVWHGHHTQLELVRRRDGTAFFSSSVGQKESSRHRLYPWALDMSSAMPIQTADIDRKILIRSGEVVLVAKAALSSDV